MRIHEATPTPSGKTHDVEDAPGLGGDLLAVRDCPDYITLWTEEGPDREAEIDWSQGFLVRPETLEGRILAALEFLQPVPRVVVAVETDSAGTYAAHDVGMARTPAEAEETCREAGFLPLTVEGMTQEHDAEDAARLWPGKNYRTGAFSVTVSLPA